MKVKLTKGHVVIAVTVAAGFALVSGCSSDKEAKGGTSDNYEYSTTEYHVTTIPGSASQASAPISTSELSATGSSNTVIPLYKESVSVGKREVDAGSVRVKKVVKTETVNQPVELRHEEIVIERVPASETAGNLSTATFQEGETVIHLTKEEPVVEKQTASAGQIVLQSRSATRQTNIQAEVRSEDVAVVKSGDSENVTVGQNIQESGGEAAVGGAESPSGQATGQSTSSQSMSGAITDPTMLSSGNASELSGRTAQFSNLKVTSVLSDNLACCDNGHGGPLYIYSAKGSSSLKAGDSINVKGIVKTSASDLSGSTMEVLKLQSAYIDAQKIERASQ